ncbi:MAG: signal peptidase I [Lachnospiraceae bacterium]|nr:signal peptidase I [Lachnospiraceae bacterium]
MEFDIEYERMERRNKVRKVFGYIIRWAIALVLAVLAGWAVINFCVEKTNMVGDSMNITLENDDIILINKLSYVRDNPKRFDVIVFEKSGTEHSYYGIQRVIGLPGEKIQIVDGVIYINGKELVEPMEVEPMEMAGLAGREMTLDEDEFFVLGDNRNHSEDSRFTTVGNVVKSEIIGKAWIRTNKFSFISSVNMPNKKAADAAAKEMSGQSAEIDDGSEDDKQDE